VAKYRLRIKRSAVKEIERIPRKADRRRIVQVIQALADDPGPPQSRKLSGRNRYRLRQGAYRIVYSIEDEVLTVYIVAVGHRLENYRKR
jgi:mRNA interferase RelE/StbE